MDVGYSSKSKLKQLQSRLIVLTERHRQLSGGHGKSGEPHLSVSVDIDNTMNVEWRAEIYSYLMDFNGGGRHHHFAAGSFKTLANQLEEAIEEEERKVAWI